MKSKSDKELLENLHKLVFDDKDIGKILKEAFDSAYSQLLDQSNTLPYSAKDISIDPFYDKIPDHLHKFIKMCRVFILKKGMRFTALENHRNSTQRLV